MVKYLYVHTVVGILDMLQIVERDKEILNDPLISEHYVDRDREYIDPVFLSGVDWADSHPTDESIDKVLRLTKEYSKIGVYAQQRINMFDYIKQNWDEY